MERLGNERSRVATIFFDVSLRSCRTSIGYRSGCWSILNYWCRGCCGSFSRIDCSDDTGLITLRSACCKGDSCPFCGLWVVKNLQVSFGFLSYLCFYLLLKVYYTALNPFRQSQGSLLKSVAHQPAYRLLSPRFTRGLATGRLFATTVILREIILKIYCKMLM